MRRRKWVLFIFFILALGIGLPYLTWKVTRADDKVKQKIMETLQPILNADSGIQALSVDISNLRLHDVVLTSKDSSISILAGEIRLGYRLRNLIRYGLNPEKVAHEVVIVHPRLIIRENLHLEAERNLFEEDSSHFQNTFFKAGQRMTLSDGEVWIESDHGTRVRFASDLNGYVHIQDVDSARVRLTGTFMESLKQNLSVSGQLDLKHLRPQFLHLQLKPSAPPRELPLLFPRIMQFAEGTMFGEGSYDRQNGASGIFHIQNASFEVLDSRLHFNRMNVRAQLDHRTVMIDGEVEDFNGASLYIHGDIQNPINPRLHLDLDSDPFLLSRFFRLVSPTANIPIEGSARLSLSARGTMEKPLIQGRLQASEFILSKLPFESFNAGFTLKDSIFTVTGNSEQPWGNLRLKSSIDFTRMDQGFSISLKTGGDLMPVVPVWMKKQLSACTGDLELRGKGWLSDFNGTAQGLLMMTSSEGQQLQLNANLNCLHKDCRLEIASTDDFYLKGRINNPFDFRVTWDMEAGGMESLVKVLSTGPVNRLADRLEVHGAFTGSLAEWMLKTQGVDKTLFHQQERFFLQAVGKKQNPDERQIVLNGEYLHSAGNALALRSEWTLSKTEILLHQLSFGEFLFFDGKFPVHETGEILGQLKMKDLDIETLHAVFPELSPYSGLVNAELDLGGSKANPQIRGFFKLQDGKFHDKGLFESDVKGEWDIAGLNTFDYHVWQNDILISEGSLERKSPQEVRCWFRGGEFEINDVLCAMSGPDQPVWGIAGFDGEVFGSPKRPSFQGRARLDNGKIGKLTFQHIEAGFEDLVTDTMDWSAGYLRVHDGKIKRKGPVTAQFSGEIPHQSSGNASFRMIARGNILSLLPEISTFFTEARSQGDLYCEIGGRHSQWGIKAGRIGIHDGYVKLSNVISEIENITATLHLEEGQSLVTIDTVCGFVEDQKFCISNVMTPNAANFSPIQIEKIGLDLGVLGFRTSGKGLKAHIPGLMEKGDTGWLSFRGTSENDPFLIAGPASNPKFSGTLQIKDIRFTYPFLKTSSKNGKRVNLGFLNALDWDIRIEPGKDVHYIRNIESPFGNLYVDLQLRESFGNFNLSGIIKEGNFEVWGQMMSTEGTLDVLNHYFKPEQVTFDYPRGASQPLLSGRAYTTIVDSLGVPSTVDMTMTTIDDATGMEMSEGEFDNIQFRFSTDNPNLGRTEAELLATLGYSGTSMKDRAYDALGMQVENIVFRPLFGPIERSIRRHLGLDVVRLSSMFSRNLMQLQTSKQPEFDPWRLLRSTKLTLGKYLAPGFFITYAGQVQNDPYYYYTVTGLTLRHAFSLEYSIRPDLFVEFEYTYDSMLLADRRVNRRVWLRHVFPF